jgi:hypothetical protein
MRFEGTTVRDLATILVLIDFVVPEAISLLVDPQKAWHVATIAWHVLSG